ncbi:hypothetical protein ZWY2020_001155 [Hordeum vulgare]|nr:hypothetical protein ZWY2020_001155 [Hordeum vulgare]
MPLTKARKAVKRSASATADARAGGGRSMSMAPPPGPAPLPPGVYFNPTHAESIAFLNRWIAGDDKMPDARGFILRADVYADDPYALEQLHPPASDRDGKHTWWFLGESKFQSLLSTSNTKRADRTVRTGGFWRVEQTKKRLTLEDGVLNVFGFYSKKRRTEWLMQEFTSDMDRGVGRKGVPALHKLYVTPRDRPTDADQTDVYDYEEEDVTARKKKHVPTDYFAAAAALLPPPAGECPWSPARAR